MPKKKLTKTQVKRLMASASKNIATLNKKKSEVTDLLNSKSKKEQGIEVLKSEGKHNQQELNKDIKRVAIALEKLVKLMTKLMKENG